MPELKFEIAGEPVGKGRPRFVSKPFPRAVTPKKTRDYENRVALRCVEAAGRRLNLTGEVEIGVVAYYGIAKSKTNRQKEQMAENQIPVLKKPDADNVLKIVKDSLNGIAYKDDSQIVRASIRKLWSYQPRVVVWLRWKDET